MFATRLPVNVNPVTVLNAAVLAPDMTPYSPDVAIVLDPSIGPRNPVEADAVENDAVLEPDIAPYSPDVETVFDPDIVPKNPVDAEADENAAVFAPAILPYIVVMTALPATRLPVNVSPDRVLKLIEFDPMMLP